MRTGGITEITHVMKKIVKKKKIFLYSTGRLRTTLKSVPVIYFTARNKKQDIYTKIANAIIYNLPI